MNMNLPLPLAEIIENVASDLPEDKSEAFTAAINQAVDGKDLSLVHWAFLGSELRALPGPLPKHMQSMVEVVVAGMELRAAGKEWHDAAKIAEATHVKAKATYTAYGAYVANTSFGAYVVLAAAHAAKAAVDAADTKAKAYVVDDHVVVATYTMAYGPSQVYEGYDATAFAEAAAKTRQRQCNTLLSLIENAKSQRTKS